MLQICELHKNTIFVSWERLIFFGHELLKDILSICPIATTVQMNQTVMLLCLTMSLLCQNNHI